MVTPGEQLPRLQSAPRRLASLRRSLAGLRFSSLLRPVGPLPLIVVIALCLPAAVSAVVSLSLDVAHSQAAARPKLAQGALDTSTTGPATWSPTGASPG